MNLLLISGSTRAGSTNTAVVRAVPELLGTAVRCLTYLDLTKLPHFNPDDDVDPLPSEVVRLRALISEADALLFCTPEYAGDLPGSLKNLLDWTVGGVEIVGKPAGWINISSSTTGAQGAHRALRVVLGYTGAAVVDEACVRMPVGRNDVSSETGEIDALHVREELGRAAHLIIKALDGASATTPR
ncbi:NADPH-dependent FMN reductase [Spongiactinospora sp. 9N601]|uniref:NADPH-dependent FMN reductase n=1 Tax=Spongiactinospora sp. 9N601 TaxID=3375149 RepID=UPI0037920A3C